MNDKKRTRPSVAAPERAGAGKLLTECIPTTKNTTQSEKGQWLIAAFLLHGRETALPLRHLVAMTGQDGREIRKAIERERRAGALIVSDNRHGYWLADSPAEAQKFARSMHHRAREILRTARAIEAAAGVDWRCINGSSIMVQNESKAL